MPSSPLLKGFFKHLDLSKVFAIRSKHPAKNARTQRRSTTTDHDDDNLIPADTLMHPGSLARDTGLEVSINASSIGSFGRVSLARDVSDMAQVALPLVQAVAAAIPFAGPPMQAAISGLLTTLQAIDRRSQNKADLDRLSSRLHRLSSHMCNAPTAQDPSEQYRRDSMIRMLRDTSAQVTQLYERGLAYTSVTQAIIGCSSEIDRYLADYSWSSQMQSQNELHQMREEQQRMREDQQRLLVMIQSQSSASTRTVTLGCVTLVDATGHEHPISVTFCTSFQQFNVVLKALFLCSSVEAHIQGRYIEQGQYDLCIDDNKQVTPLTSHEWPSFEEGTKIVMRVTIEQPEADGFDYKCHFCGAINHLGTESIMYSFERRAGCSIDCRECKRRFQISRRYLGARQGAQSSNIDSSATTNAEMRLIRNFHVQQTYKKLRIRLSLPESSPPSPSPSSSPIEPSPSSPSSSSDEYEYDSSPSSDEEEDDEDSSEYDSSPSSDEEEDDEDSSEDSSEYSWFYESPDEDDWSGFQAPRSQGLLDFDAGGTSATSHSQRREFARDGPTMSQPGHVPPSHDEYGSSGIEEIKEDSDKLDDEDRAEQSGNALSAEDGEDHEEWEDCEDGEDHE